MKSRLQEVNESKENLEKQLQTSKEHEYNNQASLQDKEQKLLTIEISLKETIKSKEQLEDQLREANRQAGLYIALFDNFCPSKVA